MCERCSPGYFFSPSGVVAEQGKSYAAQCTVRIISKFVNNCAEYSQTEEKCGKCIEKFGLAKDGLNCFSLIAKCQVYNLDKDGTQVDANGKCL